MVSSHVKGKIFHVESEFADKTDVPRCKTVSKAEIHNYRCTHMAK